MAIGYGAGKLKILDGAALRGLSKLLVEVCLPSLILMSLQKPFSASLLSGALQALLVATLFYLAVMLMSILCVRLFRYPEKKASALAFALSFSNCGFIGFPVVASILGQDALFLTAISNIPFNVFAFTVGILIMNGLGQRPLAAGREGAKARIPVRNILNANVVAAIAGFGLFLLSITLPPVIAQPLTLVGNVTTPLAMIVTGAMLARIPIRSVLGDWRLYAASVLRLAVWPLLTAVVLRLCGVRGELYFITVIIAGMPSASNTSLVAEVYGGDADMASSIVFLTTLFSVVSIPLMTVLLR